jgi:hypothetical protein
MVIDICASAGQLDRALEVGKEGRREGGGEGGRGSKI